MKRQVIRVEPLASLPEKHNAATTTVVRHGDTPYVTSVPPFEPDAARISISVSAWNGGFDIEIDCLAAV